MQIGNLPVPSSSFDASRTRRPQRQPPGEADAALRPRPLPAPARGPGVDAGNLGRASMLEQRTLNPAFQPLASHSGEYAVNTYRSVAASTGPELLNRVDVSA